VSWLFSQALVAESLGENCLDGKPSVQSKSTATAPVYYVGDKTKEFSRLSRFGMTLQPLTADRGEALLKSFLEVFLAKTFQQPEEEQASPENVRDSGVRWRELSVKYDQDLSSWRTHQCLFQEVLEESSLTLPRWGLMRNGELSERTTPEHLTNETESGFWPTPTVAEVTKIPACANFGQVGLNNHPRIRGYPTRPKLQKSRKKEWPTPTCHNAKEAAYPAEFTRKTPTLTSQAHGGQPTQPMPLNPTWVEWLMGWPIGWTDSKQLETDKFQQWWNSHGERLETVD